MYNRYLSNAAPQRLEEPTGTAATRQRLNQPTDTATPQRLNEPTGTATTFQRQNQPTDTAAPQRDAGLLERLRGLLSRFGGGGEEKSLFVGVPVLEKLDSGDILLILVLIFLFRESGDEEWLIILALVLLMGL